MLDAKLDKIIFIKIIDKFEISKARFHNELKWRLVNSGLPSNPELPLRSFKRFDYGW